MKYKKLDRTGLMVSEICLGTITFGNQTDEAESLKLIRWASDVNKLAVGRFEPTIKGL